MKFSLVIPCYNESDNIPLLLDRCRDLGAIEGYEIILVNNGSLDNSKDVLAQLVPDFEGCRVVNIPVNKGYGYGIVTGLRAAKGEIIGWTHADLQTDPIDAKYGLELFDKHGLEIFVKGKRYGRPLADTVFTTGMTIFETLLLGKSMHDINAQPTMFSKEFFETWVSPPNDFSLDLYAYYFAKKRNLKIARFPVKFGKRAYGMSTWNVDWRSKLKFIRRTIEFSIELKKRL